MQHWRDMRMRSRQLLIHLLGIFWQPVVGTRVCGFGKVRAELPCFVSPFWVTMQVNPEVFLRNHLGSWSLKPGWNITECPVCWNEINFGEGGGGGISASHPPSKLLFTHPNHHSFNDQDSSSECSTNCSGPNYSRCISGKGWCRLRKIFPTPFLNIAFPFTSNLINSHDEENSSDWHHKLFRTKPSKMPSVLWTITQQLTNQVWQTKQLGVILL